MHNRSFLTSICNYRRQAAITSSPSSRDVFLKVRLLPCATCCTNELIFDMVITHCRRRRAFHPIMDVIWTSVIYPRMRSRWHVLCSRTGTNKSEFCLREAAERSWGIPARFIKNTAAVWLRLQLWKGQRGLIDGRTLAHQRLSNDIDSPTSIINCRRDTGFITLTR